MAESVDGPTRRLHYWSGLAIVALYIAYALATIGGFLQLGSSDEPISDPWFAAMEWIILVLCPAILIFLSSLAGIVPPDRRAWVLAAIANAAIALGLSAALHAMLLCIDRTHPLVADGGALSFTWPSIAYAIDILAWDWFFAVAMLCCGISLRGEPTMHLAANMFFFGGTLAMVGLAGPLTGSMPIRNIGIAGYAVFFPCSVGVLMWTLHRNERIAGSEAMDQKS